MGADALTLSDLPHLAAVLEEYAAAVRNAYQDALIRRNKVASGELLNGAEYRVTVDGRTIAVQLSLAPWWKYVEQGRKPGGKFPPRDAILRWIEVKPVIPRPDKGGRLPSKQSLAYLIGRKIAREGIPATHAMAGAVEGMNQLWLERIGEAIALDIRGAFVTGTFGR